MQVKITLDAPGSTGELTRTLTPEQYKFLMWLAIQWNLENPAHAAPFFYVESLDEVPEVGL